VSAFDAVARSFLRPRTVTRLQGMIRRGLTTVGNLQEPPVVLDLYRLNESTNVYEDVGQREFYLRYGVAGISGISEVTAGALSSGTMRCFDTLTEPANVQVGDHFSLPDGHAGVVTEVPPTRFQILTAVWVMDEGSV
jgi:hypothetical protein